MSILWRIEMALDNFAMSIDNAFDTVKETCEDLAGFAKDTKDDFKELGQIVVEGTVDLAGEAVASSLDYVSEKTERYFENWEAILSDHPYIDGKKTGCERAAYAFEILYQQQEKENEQLISAIKMCPKPDLRIDCLKTNIEKKKEELRRLKAKRQENIDAAAKASGYSKEDVIGFISNTKCSTLFDLISNKKLREMKKGELDGFNEAKELFKKRLEDMQSKYNKMIDDLIALDEAEMALYIEICEDIRKANEEIESLNLFFN